MRQIAATRRRDSRGYCNKSPCGTCKNHCRIDKISASSLFAACVGICDKSLRKNVNQPMREHQLGSRHIKFELVYISSLQKSIACTEQVSYSSDLSQQQCRRGDMTPRCVTAICRIRPDVQTNFILQAGKSGVSRELFSDKARHIVIVIVIFLGQVCPRGKGAMRLALCDAATRETRPDHNTGNNMPYSFRQVRGFFNLSC